MTSDEIKASVSSFICRGSQGAGVGEDVDIFASGYVNSLFALEIVMFIERQFKIDIDDEDLELDNFRSINAVARFVAQKSAVTN
jgi:methoxymalonate biosynthesis acyl carrier protein